MISGCYGGTGCSAGWCYCGDGHRTDTIVIRVTPNTYASNIPDPYSGLSMTKEESKATKEELKALTRAICKELTLAAQEDLAWVHDHEEVPEGYPNHIRYRRPGRRRTCTAVRNFRGRP